MDLRGLIPNTLPFFSKVKAMIWGKSRTEGANEGPIVTVASPGYNAARGGRLGRDPKEQPLIRVGILGCDNRRPGAQTGLQAPAPSPANACVCTKEGSHIASRAAGFVTFIYLSCLGNSH